MSNISKDLFINLVNLSQVDDQEMICSKFIELLHDIFPGLKFSLNGYGNSHRYERLSIETKNHRFGDIIMGEKIEKLNPGERSYLYSAIQMLAVILENKLHEKDQSDRNLSLESRNDSNTKELEEQKERLTLVLEGADLGFWDYDVQARELMINEKWAQMLGYNHIEIDSPIEFIKENLHPDDAERVTKNMQNIVRGLISSLDMEFRLKTKDGNYKWISLKGKVTVRDDDGNVLRLSGIHKDIDKEKEDEKIELTLETGEMQVYQYDIQMDEKKATFESRMVKNEEDEVLFIGRDISEQIETQELLKESKERYETFINKTTEGIYRLELEEPIPTDDPIEEQLKQFYEKAYLAECNHAFAQMYGINNPKELIGYRVTDLYGVEEQNPNYKQNQLFIRNGYQLTNVETIEKDMEGNSVYILNNSIGIVENSHLVRVWGGQSNITEKKKSELIFRNVWEKAKDGMRIVDENGVIRDVNEAYCSMVQMNRDELVGQPISILYNKDKERVLNKHFERFKNRTIPPKMEREFELHDGTRKWFALTNSYLNIPGETEKVLAIFRDITERKLYEEELDYLRKFETILRKLSSAFLSASADDLDEVISDGIGKVGKFMEADRSYLFMLDNKRDDTERELTISNSHEWCADGINPEIDNLEKIPASIFPKWMEKLYNGENIPIDDVPSLDDEWKNVRELLKAQNIKSVCLVPIMKNDELIGFLGFDSVRRYREWSRKEISMLEILSELLSNAIYQREIEKDLLYNSLILSNLNESVIAADESKRITYWNKAAERLYGYSPNEVIGINVEDLISVENLDRNEVYEKVLKDGHWQGEGVHKGKNGKMVEVDWSMQAIRDNNGNFLGAISIAQDISEWKESEKEIRKLSHAIEQSSVSIVITDKDGNIEYVNPFFTKITGYLSDEVIGESTSILKSGKHSEETYKKLWETITSGNDWKGRLLNKRKDGKLFWENVVISPIINEAGEITNYIAVKEDITEKHQMEKALEENRKQLENLMNNLPGMAYRCINDENWTLLFVSNGCYDLTGYRSSDLINNKLVSYDDLIYADDEEYVWNKVQRAIADDRHFEITYRIKDKDGNIRWVSERGKAVSNGNQDEHYIEGLIIDITEQKRISDELENYRNNLEQLVKTRTEELEVTNRKLENEIAKQKEAEETVKKALEKEKELNQLKTHFVSMVSHEFRTPLTSILASADLLDMYGRVWKEEKYYNHVGKIQHSVEDMREMLEDILTISRTERGKLKFNPGYVNLDRVCGDIVEEQKLQAHDEHEIIYNYRAKSEKYYLDEKLIGQILNNLLSNAIKFSPKGGKVEVDIIDEDGILKMRVEDEGLGIPEHEKKTIFEPFSRGNEVSDIKGSGLGTTIMKNAADLHNASIEFESKLGKGTTFVVTFNQTQD